MVYFNDHLIRKLLLLKIIVLLEKTEKDTLFIEAKTMSAFQNLPLITMQRLHRFFSGKLN